MTAGAYLQFCSCSATLKTVAKEVKCQYKTKQTTNNKNGVNLTVVYFIFVISAKVHIPRGIVTAKG